MLFPFVEKSVSYSLINNTQHTSVIQILTSIPVKLS
jgi:hypothetical protein